MAILNQFGYEYPNKLVNAAGRMGYRDYATKDLNDLIPQLDHQKIISGSRKLYANVGQVRAVVEQKATYSVGKAFQPIFKGVDRDWGEKAAETLSGWLNHADLSRFNDWQTILFLASVEMDRDGDAFILLTENPGSRYPQIQMIPSNRIGQDDPNEKEVKSGRYRGKRIEKGVIYDRKTGRAVAYRCRNDDGTYRDIPAGAMIHLIDPQWVGQKRGLPLFSSAINVFRDLKTASEREQFAQMLLSSLVIAEHNPTGGPDDDDITQIGSSDGTTVNVQNFEQGMVKYFQSNTGSKLESIINQRPTIEWQTFQDRLLKESVVGCGWSMSLLEGNADFNSVATRLSIKLAEKAVEDRQSLLVNGARRIVTYAIARFIELGILEPNEEFWKWGFSLPKKISIDAGRDSAALINEYDKGFITLEEILSESGTSLETHLRQKAKEEIMAIQIRKEAYEAAGLEFNNE